MKPAAVFCSVAAFMLAASETQAAAEAARSTNVWSTTFGDDVEFLRKYTEVIVLRDQQGGSQIAVSPAWQGRVMTSTAQGSTGTSFGWINRGLIALGRRMPHINAFGGEDRLWLGPEGGQFSLYFAKGVPFDLKYWYVPASLDTRPFEIAQRSGRAVSFKSEFNLTNYSGTAFHVAIHRQVRMLEPGDVWRDLGVPPAEGLRLVAYESHNALTNLGPKPWRRDTGLMSIWILGMFNPAPTAIIFVPVRPGPESALGSKVTSDYFGAVPPERLKVFDAAVFLRADGGFRSKIGINPRRSLGKLASYDPEHGVLTIVQCNQPEGVIDYVNSLWKVQDDPYSGDALNAYNDGPPAPGVAPLGPFFELETSSPAAALSPGASVEHTHRTIHLTGPEEQLDKIARQALGVPLSAFSKALNVAY